MKIQVKIYIILSVCFGIIFIPETKCQISIDTSVLFISARSGLNLRKSPTVSSEKIITGKYGQAVQPKEVISEEITLDGKRGNWLKVILNDKIGYLFSGYLSKLPRFDKELFSIQINNRRLEDPISILSKYFRLVLFEIREREIKIIQECGNDPDCQYGKSQEIRFMNNGFSLVEHRAYEVYEEEVIGDDWSYDDAKDLVDWIIYPLWKDEVEIVAKENSNTYTKKEGEHGFVSYIHIKKLSEHKISISWGGYH